MPKTPANRPPESLRSRPDDAAVTIGGLARAAEVGVETVRYYQRRHLLAVPHSAGGVRRYPRAIIDRIRLIKRSQNLGFTLDEIRESIAGNLADGIATATLFEPHELTDFIEGTT